ncbi:MFS transporter [Paraburkholderia fungorum]|uniref:MFS transporter n=1 Tax=Paraburkholderia fungorum TaxID=134537 RepID=UPI0038BA6A65
MGCRLLVSMENTPCIAFVSKLAVNAMSLFPNLRRSAMTSTRNEFSVAERAHRKSVVRLIPFLFVCYIFAYLDRINISFAKQQLSHALGLSDAAYGLAAGVFFVGYVLFEVPSNLLLARIGARRTFGRILILWGVVSVATSFVVGATSLQIMRFLLGVFEAGLAPGILFYLTLWFGPRQIGSVLAMFISSTALAGVIGAPLSTLIMTYMDGKAGLMGYQWMFVIEGLPPILLGLIAYATLPNRPAEARWLSDAEKLAIMSSLERPAPCIERTYSSPFRDPVVYAMSLCYFGFICGLYAITFWMPTFIANAGAGNLLETGLFGAIPYATAVVLMYVLARRSDIRRERIRHSAFPAVLAAVLLAIMVRFHGNFALSMVCVSLATGCIYAAYGVFWTIPSEYFATNAAPGGFAFVNSIGLLGGLASPTAMGWIKQVTGSLDYAFLAIAVVVLFSALGLLALSGRLQGNPVKLTVAGPAGGQ